jgi:hypothetical protein
MHFTMEKANNETGKQEKRDYLAVGEVFSYFFRKKDPNQKSNFNLRMMHGINKFSILVFLAAFVFWLFKRMS